jgi:CHAD domain-containing protein
MRHRDPMKRRARPTPGQTADRALRRLLARYFCQVRQAEPLAAKGSVEGLHDLRVALRKIRNVALLFKELDPVFLGDLARQISKVSDRMGLARDMDVWVGLFREMDVAGVLHRVPLQDHRAVEKGFQKKRKRLASAALSDRLFREVKKRLRAYVRSPAPKRPKSFPLPEAFAARQMLVVRDLIDARYRRVGSFSCNRSHNLRKAGRRMRYLAEFFAASIGTDTVEAGEWVTRAQSALGKVHDCDSALELSVHLPTAAGRAAVQQALKNRRADSLHKFKTAWRQYADRRLQQAWQAQLEAAASS